MILLVTLTDFIFMVDFKNIIRRFQLMNVQALGVLCDQLNFKVHIVLIFLSSVQNVSDVYIVFFFFVAPVKVIISFVYFE